MTRQAKNPHHKSRWPVQSIIMIQIIKQVDDSDKAKETFLQLMPLGVQTVKQFVHTS